MTPNFSFLGVQKPLPPRNITEGVTTLRKGYVDVWIHWQKPHYSDIPIWKYKVSDIPIWKYKVSDIPSGNTR